MSLSTVLASIKTWLVGAEQWFEALFSKLVREEQELVPQVEAFLQKAEAAINSPGATIIENLIPDGIGTEVASIANEIIAFLLSELTGLSGVISTGVSNNGTPILANQDAVAKAAFQKVSQMSADGQSAFLASYGTTLLKNFAPSGSNVSYEEAQITMAAAKIAKTTA